MIGGSFSTDAGRPVSLLSLLVVLVFFLFGDVIPAIEKQRMWRFWPWSQVGLEVEGKNTAPDLWIYGVGYLQKSLSSHLFPRSTCDFGFLQHLGFCSIVLSLVGGYAPADFIKLAFLCPVSGLYRWGFSPVRLGSSADPRQGLVWNLAFSSFVWLCRSHLLFVSVRLGFYPVLFGGGF